MSRTSERPVFRLDGVEVPYAPGETLIEAATRAGRDVPHLCWTAELGASGSCRLCIVDVDGRHVAACTTRAEAGREVACRTPALDAQRRALLAMLFAEGRHFCPGCEKSGDCQLQSRAYQMDLQGSNWEPFMPDRPVDASHPDVMLDATRCILCGLCVRASEHVDGKGVFAIDGHGIGAHLVVDAPDGRLGSSRLALEDRATHVCPVGALLPKRRGFAVPIGERPEDRAPLPEPARIPSGDRPAYSTDEGLTSPRAERWAAPEPARIPSGDRPAYPTDEGLTSPRAERWAAPEPARIPSGDRPAYPTDEGLT